MISILVKWVIITGIVLVIGEVIYEIFKDSYFILTGIAIAEMVLLVVLSLGHGNFLQNFILIVMGSFMCIQYVRKLNKLPKVFRKFYSVEESLNLCAGGMYGYGILAAFLIWQELAWYLPVRIEYFERYLYVDIFLCMVVVVFAMPQELEFPSKVLNWINTKDVLTQDVIDEFVEALEIESESSDDIEDKVYKTLADFAKIGILEIDDANRCFRKK